MTTARYAAAAITITPKKIWITGGWDDIDGGNPLKSTEYQGESEGNGPDLPRPLSSHCLARMDQKSILVTGGTDGPFNALRNSWIFDISSEEWTNGPSMNQARRSHGCTTLPSSLIVVGGGRVLASVEVLNRKEWTTGNLLYVYNP